MSASDAKRTLFTTWLKLGRTRVLFDSSLPGVEIAEQFKNMASMWVLIDGAKVYPDKFTAQIHTANGEDLTVSVPWEAIHTLESIKLEEVHLWGGDLDAAHAREKARGGPVLRN